MSPYAILGWDGRCVEISGCARRYMFVTRPSISRLITFMEPLNCKDIYNSTGEICSYWMKYFQLSHSRIQDYSPRTFVFNYWLKWQWISSKGNSRYSNQLFFYWIELKTKTSSKRQQSCRLVEFLVFNSAFGRRRHILEPITLSLSGGGGGWIHWPSFTSSLSSSYS